jgi:hypothetical protein
VEIERSFMKSQWEISKLALLISLFVLPIYLFALISNVCVSDSQIYYRPNIFFRLRTYGMSQIKESAATMRERPKGVEYWARDRND